jgi:hypothetical protein
MPIFSNRLCSLRVGARGVRGSRCSAAHALNTTAMTIAILREPIIQPENPVPAAVRRREPKGRTLRLRQTQTAKPAWAPQAKGTPTYLKAHLEPGALTRRLALHARMPPGLEGIVSNKLSAPYRSGPSRDWIKVKNPDSPAMARHREERWQKRDG